LDFLNIDEQQTPVNAAHYSVIILGLGVEFPQLYTSDSYPNSICRPKLYWPMLFTSCTIASCKRPT